MTLGSGELAQIVWAETKDLPPGKADGTGDANGVRRLLAQLAASVDGAGFEKRASLPSLNDRNFGDTARAVMAIADVAKDAGQPQSRLIFWEAGSNTERPNGGAIAPPTPWGTADGITYHGRAQLVGGRIVDIFSRPPVETGDDGAPFVNALTGTGMPDGKPLVVPKSAWNGAKPRTGYKLFLIALALFLFAGLWSYGVGLASRLTLDEFSKVATLMTAEDQAGAAKPDDAQPVAAKPDGGKADAQKPVDAQVNCSAKTPSGRDYVLGPQQWRPIPKGVNRCVELYADAQRTVADERSVKDSWVRSFANLALRASGSSGASVSLTLPLLLGFVAFALLFVSAGYSVCGRPMGAIIDDRYRMSLTLTQAVLWAVVIAGAWLVLGFYNIGFGGVEYSKLAQSVVGNPDPELKKLFDLFLVFPKIPSELWGVLGLAAGTPFLSRLVADTNIVTGVGGAAAPTPGRAGSDYLENNLDPSQASLSDMVLKETQNADHLVDPTRVQHVAFTAILVASYVMLLFGASSTIDPTRVTLAALETKSVFTNMPAVDGTFLALLFVSHATLLMGKVYDKKTTVPSSAEGSPHH